MAAPFLIPAGLTQTPESPMVEPAVAFLASLPEDLRKAAVLPFDSASRTDWAYTPRTRPGVSWRDFDEKSRAAARRLLQSALSEEGYRKIELVRELEAILREVEGAHRDPQYYVFTFFGEPSEKGVWGWRYEGHHLSLNYTFRDGKAVSSTPQFFGANPAEVRSGPKQGLRSLAAEEDLARALLSSLDSAQRAKAILSDSAPADIVTSNLRKAARQADAGIKHRELRGDQKKALEALVATHASAQSAALAKGRMDSIRQAGWGDVAFAWMGGTQKGERHYYRVQGDTFLIEYDNTQNRANHIHTVWRNFKGDFGEDLLARHYSEAAHHRSDARR